MNVPLWSAKFNKNKGMYVYVPFKETPTRRVNKGTFTNHTQPYIKQDFQSDNTNS